ncbi:PDZ domain-containing protein [Seinonella peptonophila]|uniref:PDZ domain-containing protein n=1 Tax=Seinonella peptonophila TaxID=112248 RepID=A0A1M4UTV7_9BACL|nr:SepM family pheromone-processing serine protease [Seinonella peptonophila]SHE60191.1 PDZ domain-containing protein [Seinonella peptonophila]
MRIYRSIFKQVLIGVVAAILVIGLFTWPIPYYVMGAGSAEEIKPTIWVEGKTSLKEKGDFLLTTVSVREGTIFDYLRSKFSSEMELVARDKMVLQGETNQEYELRQKEEMIQSQNAAVVAAFRQAHRPLQIKQQGVKILGFARKPISGLQVGDQIEQIDQHAIPTVTKLHAFLENKRAGDQITLTIRRDGQKLTRKVKLISLSSKQVGIGIVPRNQVSVQSKPKVRITTGEIGGPSAGLMLSLELLNRLVAGDMTHGLRIAGTGTIDEGGQVGQIGGIKYKIMSAAKEKAAYFFCPKDQQPTDENEQQAKQTVKKLGLPIRVIPVRSLQEAVDYLGQLTSAGHLAYT